MHVQCLVYFYNFIKDVFYMHYISAYVAMHNFVHKVQSTYISLKYYCYTFFAIVAMLKPCVECGHKYHLRYKNCPSCANISEVHNATPAAI